MCIIPSKLDIDEIDEGHSSILTFGTNIAELAIH